MSKKEKKIDEVVNNTTNPDETETDATNPDEIENPIDENSEQPTNPDETETEENQTQPDETKPENDDENVMKTTDATEDEWNHDNVENVVEDQKWLIHVKAIYNRWSIDKGCEYWIEQKFFEEKKYLFEVLED